MLDTLKAIQPNMTHFPRLERPPTFTTHPSRIAFLITRGMNLKRVKTAINSIIVESRIIRE